VLNVNAPEVALKYFLAVAGEIISKAGSPKPPVTVTCTVAELAIQVGAVVTAKLKSVGGVKAGVTTFSKVNVQLLASRTTIVVVAASGPLFTVKVLSPVKINH
jgi:hypothetical protein